jgi:hypothetical protein
MEVRYNFSQRIVLTGELEIDLRERGGRVWTGYTSFRIRVHDRFVNPLIKPAVS